MRLAFVGNTDRDWFDFLRSCAVAGRLDEVNFWKPGAQAFKKLPIGAPFFLRLKKPVYRIAGFGFFAAYNRLTQLHAWQLFQEKNGAANLDSFVRAVNSYRPDRGSPLPTDPRFSLVGCIALRDVQFLDESDWTYWRENVGWVDQNPPGSFFDLDSLHGQVLDGLLSLRPSAAAPELHSPFALVEDDERRRMTASLVVREGQAAFRMRLLNAYEGRCAFTGERTVPVLDAAHIQPYSGPRSNHLQNGLMVRADLHALFDEGLITVTPELRVRVSSEIGERYHNGRIYYDLADKPLKVTPRDPRQRPSEAALDWHSRTLFMP